MGRMLCLVLLFSQIPYANASDTGWAAQNLSDTIKIYRPALNVIEEFASKAPSDIEKKTALDLSLCLMIGQILKNEVEITRAGWRLIDKISDVSDRAAIDEETFRLTLARGAMMRFCSSDASDYRDLSYLKAQAKAVHEPLDKLSSLAAHYEDTHQEAL